MTPDEQANADAALAKSMADVHAELDQDPGEGQSPTDARRHWLDNLRLPDTATHVKGFTTFLA